MLIEIFRAGTHIDSAGNKRTWTEKDLDIIANKYNPKEHEAPVVIGHPKDNAPAFGWVERLERKGGSLYAKLKDLVPEFVEMVKKGLYKKRSISLYPDMTLRHVGFLGAMPPAVKGLADVEFSEGGAVTIEFADYRLSMIGRIFQRIREFLIEKYDTETADRVINNWEIEDLQREKTEIEAETASAFNEGGQDMDKTKELEEKLKEEQERSRALEQQFKEKEAEIARLEAKIEREQAEKRKMEFQAFCEELIREGKLTPAMKPMAIDFMEILSAVGEYEFTEEKGDKVTAVAVTKFKDFLSSLPKQVEFSELATKERAPKAGGAEDIIYEYMEKNKGISYKEAVLAVSKRHPELFK